MVHVDTSNIVICIDWHDTIDQALNPLGLLDNWLVDKFRQVARVAGNRVEFHIVSDAGASKIEQTRESAEYFISDLIGKGINFKELYLTRYPCGQEGKSSVVTALQAYCLIDDRGDILNEASQTGCKTIKSQGRGDRERSYLAVVEDWIRQETVQGILTNRGAIPL